MVHMSNYDEIAKRAYELWEQAGKPDGQDTEFWLQAEGQIGQREQSNGGQKRQMQAANERGRRVGA